MDWTVERAKGAELDLAEVIDVYRSSGLGDRRPVTDENRFAQMVLQANLIIVCRVDGLMVGIARCLSDFSYVTYLSDMAVAAEYQKKGIGRALIDGIQGESDEAKIVLLAAPDAVGYYPRIGFSRHESAWVLNP